MLFHIAIFKAIAIRRAWFGHRYGNTMTYKELYSLDFDRKKIIHRYKICRDTNTIQLNS